MHRLAADNPDPDESHAMVTPIRRRLAGREDADDGTDSATAQRRRRLAGRAGAWLGSSYVGFGSLVALWALAAACSNAPAASGGADAIVVVADGGGDATVADASAPDAPGADADAAGDVAADTGGGSDTARDVDADRPDVDDVGADTACVPAVEACNGIDDDCDGAIDEDFALDVPCDVGVGRCARSGVQVCDADGAVACTVAPGGPDLEVCDGRDDDCDGEVDEGCARCGTVARETALPDGIGAADITGVATDGATTWVAASEQLVRIGADGEAVVRTPGLADDGGQFGVAMGPRGQLLALGASDDAGLTLSTLDDVGVRSRDLVAPLVPTDAALASDAARVAVAWTADGTSRVATRDLSVDEPGAVLPEVDLGTGRVVGVAIVDTRVTVALAGPSRLVVVDAGRASWALDLGGDGFEVAALADDGEQLAVVGHHGGQVEVITVDRRAGTVAWRAVIGEAPEARARAVSFDDGGRLRVAYDGTFDGDAGARVVLVEPGVGAVGWVAGWRYTTTIAVTDTAAGGVVHVGSYLGPTPRGVHVRRLHRPCVAERGGDAVRTWVLSGQSNMVGYGRIAELPDALAAPYEAVDMYYEANRRITPVGPASFGGLFGPEIAFARDVAMAYPNDRLMLVKYAVGGTNLYSQWAPGEGPDDPFRGGLYRVWQGVIADAVAANAMRGLGTNVVGMAWMQGESDGFDEGNAVSYAANLMRFVRRTRDDLGTVRTLPFAIGRISAPTVPQRDLVRAGQAVAADALLGATLVDTDDLPLGDDIHYDTEGTLTLGRRLAAAALHARADRVRELAPRREPSTWVDEAVDYELVAALDIPAEAFWLRESDVPWAVDRRGDPSLASFDRVAWLVELDARDREPQAVWVSAAAFGPMNALGVPVDVTTEAALDDVSVRSTEAGVGPIDGIGGRIEAWSSCYNPGADGRFDAFDLPFGVDCYGSLQVHAALDADAPTLTPVFAFNRWATAQDGLDIGIGASTLLHPDWTFTRAGRGWEVRRIAFYVRPVE